MNITTESKRRGTADWRTPSRNAVKDFLTREKAWVYVVAEVVRLRAMPENARILTNSATKILNGVARRGGPPAIGWLRCLAVSLASAF